MRVKLGDIIKRVEGRVNAQTAEEKYYLGKGHGECGEIAITQHGDLDKDRGTLGMAFKFSFKKGDVLFMSRSFANRKAGMVMFDGICSEKTFVLYTKDTSILLQEWLPAIIQNDEFWRYCEANKAGGVNNFINWSTLADYEFDLPPIEEQRVLADKLWAAYRLKESYRRLLAATQEMVKSQFIEMFGRTNDNDPMLKDVANIYDGTHKTPNYVEKGIPFISVENIEDIYNPEKFISQEDFEKYKHRPEFGDVFMTRIGNIGKCAVYESDLPLAYYVSLALIKPNKNRILSKFLKCYLESIDGCYELKQRSLLKAIPMKINLGEIGNIRIPIPPMDLQEQFVAIAEQADKSGFELRKSIDAIDNVIKSLINNQS